MSNLVRTEFGKQIEEIVIDAGLKIPDSPIASLKLGLQLIKDKREEQFLTDLLSSLTHIGLKDINANKSLEKIYKSLQVIAKATTQEKINRFKKLTINGIFYQNSTSDNDYELYLSLVDNLNDEEFLALKYLLDITIPSGKDNSIESFYKKTGIRKQELRSYIQRLVSYGVAEEQFLLEPQKDGQSFFSHPVLEIEADDYPQKKIPKYYKISKLGEMLLNFINLNSEKIEGITKK